MTDALAADGEEGRGKRRYSTARRRRPVTRGSPNGATPQGDPCDPALNQIGAGGDTGGSETSQYPEERKSNEIPPVAASERGPAQTGGFIPRGCRAGVGPSDGSAGAWKGAPQRVTAPCAKPSRRRAGTLSRAGHVKPRPNPGGPPPKAEYKPLTDSARVP